MAGGNNIQALREAKGWSRPELGKRMGTSGQQVERLEKAMRRLTQDWIEKAAKALGVSPADIISSAPPTLPSDHAPTRSASAGELVEIAKLDLSLSMGPGTLIDDWVEEEPVTFDAGLLRAITRAPFPRLKVVTGIGDSMYPTLNWGDTILIDTTDRALGRQDAIYWVSVYGAAGIKRLRTIGPNRILVISDNPSVADQEVSAEDLRIEGRAIWFARGL